MNDFDEVRLRAIELAQNYLIARYHLLKSNGLHPDFPTNEEVLNLAVEYYNFR